MAEPRKWTLDEIKEIRSSPDGVDKLRKRFGTNTRTIKLIREAASEEDALAIPEGMELETPLISPKGDASVMDGYKGYEQDKEAYLFIRLPNGRIRDFRLEFPEVLSLYKMCKNEDKIGYQGDFPHFMADCAQTMFALAGYDLLLAPRSLQIVYDETARLVRENKLLTVFDENGRISKLEVNDGAKDTDSKGGVQPGTGEHQPKGLLAKQGEEEPGQSQ